MVKTKTETEKYLNFHEGNQVFSLDGAPRSKDGWQLIGCMDPRTAVAFRDFLRYQYSDRKIHLPADEAEHTLSNLRRFVSFYKDYVLDKSFEIMDEKAGKVIPINELI